MTLKDFPVHATIAVKDPDRARLFYERELGFAPASVAPNAVFYECAGGTRFFIYPSQTAGTNRVTYAGWAVPDIEAVVKELKRMNILGIVQLAG
jgi:catechol 2,3-dioxygenase-like lactoylglutathione lyase family enzyme